MSSDLEAAVDALYAGDPDEFVASRDRLARELTRAGDRQRGSEVKKLRRPSVAAAALNRLARTDPQRVAELLDLGTRLAAAQQDAVTGGGAAALRELTTVRRALVAHLAATAGSDLTPAAREAVTATLEAATVDADVGEALRAGRLTTEASATGFGLDLFALAATTPPRKPPTPAPAVRAPKRDTQPDAPSAPERTAERAAAEAAQRRVAAEIDEQAMLAAKAEVATRERALREAKKALSEAQRKAQRSELAAATAEHKAWELGERNR